MPVHRKEQKLHTASEIVMSKTSGGGRAGGEEGLRSRNLDKIYIKTLKGRAAGDACCGNCNTHSSFARFPSAVGGQPPNRRQERQQFALRLCGRAFCGIFSALGAGG